ncbi:uncharacterized protein LOC131624186 [Vicia villosa]|uniref:uncharacterized protein LOC131624186 n=1 Tax=Vicia villosa TaxID=3911 RepID=UPI00273B9133|nr:uncharacterized protein LOC131624186 [Vicia villosa]
MHQKKSEVQIGKESIGVSSDFNPTPPIQHNHHQNYQRQHLCPRHHSIDISPTQSPLPQKQPPINKPPLKPQTQNAPFFSLTVATSSAAFRILRRLKKHRSLFLISLPLLYLYLLASRSFFLDFLTALAFSTALLFSLNIALPSLRSFPLHLTLRKLHPSSPSSRSPPPLPVFWTIGSRPKSEKRLGSGCWVQVFGNGDFYEGEFHRGKCSGSGVYYYSMSGKYEGDWIDGRYDGYGVETWARGSRYRGQYRQGLRHGFGVYRFYTGDVYAGEWSNGQSHGCGVHTCEDGSRYVGEFKWGVKHGLGHYHFRNGDTYAGEYFADKMHGFGAYRFANGHRYEGAWHEGRRQGLGMYTFRNGETQSGHWQNGVLDVPSTQNTTYPVSPVGVNHSKVLNAVQEARRAAEKANDVGKVDERVNRAVSAANRAANAARVAAVKAVQKQMHHHVNNESFQIPVM